MITTKKELAFYIEADRIMNGYPKAHSLKSLHFSLNDRRYIQKYLEVMRKYAYCCNTNQNILKKSYYKYKFTKLGAKLGFSIDYNTFGYGLVIPHLGTIVVGGPNKIGNFTVLHTSTCIAGGGKLIGDGFYLSSGSVVTGKICLGNNVTIGACSLVNHTIEGDNITIAGVPALKKKEGEPWYVRDGIVYTERFRQVNELRNKHFENENTD